MALGRERFELASLGDLVELLIEGWRIDRLHYADRSGAVVIPSDDLRPVLEEAARIEERDAAEVERLRAADLAR